MAILVAVVSWPLRVPDDERRMCSVPCPVLVREALSDAFGLDDFGHGHAELVLDQDDFAARHQAVIDVDVDRFADPAVEFEHHARPEVEQAADVHLRAAEHRPRPAPARRTPLRASAVRAIGSRRLATIGTTSLAMAAVLQIGKRDLVVVGHRPRPSSLFVTRGASRGDVAADGLVDQRFGPARSRMTPPSAHSDPAVAGRDVGFAEHHQAALEAAQRGDLRAVRLRLLVQAFVHAHGDVRRAAQLAQATACERGDLFHRLARDQFLRQLAWPTAAATSTASISSLALDPAERTDDAIERGADVVRSAAAMRRSASARACASAANSCRCGSRAPRPRRPAPGGRARSTLGMAAPIAEVGVEQEFGARGHGGLLCVRTMSDVRASVHQLFVAAALGDRDLALGGEILGEC